MQQCPRISAFFDRELWASTPSQVTSWRRADIAVAGTWQMIMLDGHCLAMPPVTALDDQFGTHTVQVPATCAGNDPRSFSGNRFGDQKSPPPSLSTSLIAR
jgi:hypothetical protein